MKWKNFAVVKVCLNSPLALLASYKNRTPSPSFASITPVNLALMGMTFYVSFHLLQAIIWLMVLIPVLSYIVDSLFIVFIALTYSMPLFVVSFIFSFYSSYWMTVFLTVFIDSDNFYFFYYQLFIACFWFLTIGIELV